MLEAVADGSFELGFVPIENAIEGTVSETVDGLIHDVDLHIQREVVMDIHLHLMARPGTDLADIASVASYPHALAQCYKFLARELPGGRAAGDQLDGGRRPPARRVGRVAIRPPSLHGWPPSAMGSSSWPRTSRITPRTRPGSSCWPARRCPERRGTTRPPSCASSGPTIRAACTASSASSPARNINLTKLESRPTKRGLGDYCFVIDLSGHVGDEVVADCLRDLHAGLAGVKFLGSYPAAGKHGPAQRRQADAAWRAADDWLQELRRAIG